MDSDTASRPAHPILLAPGLLIALAALLTFAGIAAYFASGAVADDPGDPVQAGRAIAAASPLLAVSAYLSIAGNVAFAIGGLMLAHLAGWIGQGARHHHRMDLPGVWATLVLGVLLILPFDLALPRGLIPLARADVTGATFAALYETVNLVHSVGLVVFYLGTTALFVHQARTAPSSRTTWGWRVATGVSVLAVVVAVGLVIERPPLVLVPTVFLTWLGLLWLGLRTVWGRRPEAHGVRAATQSLS